MMSKIKNILGGREVFVRDTLTLLKYLFSRELIFARIYFQVREGTNLIHKERRFGIPMFQLMFSHYPGRMFITDVC